jgi:hypothetical protein
MDVIEFIASLEGTGMFATESEEKEMTDGKETT